MAFENDEALGAKLAHLIKLKEEKHKNLSNFLKFDSSALPNVSENVVLRIFASQSFRGRHRLCVCSMHRSRIVVPT